MTKTLEQVLASLPPERRERVLAEAELLALETGLSNDLAALVAAGEITEQIAGRREYNRRYHENNREKLLKNKRRYHEENREEEAEKSRLYRENNRERLREGNCRYYRANKEKVREKNRRYCARRRTAKYSAEEIELIKEQARQEAREQLLAELKKGNLI